LTPTVEFKGISKRFGDVQALEDVAMSVHQGEIHAVLGENGAGKTTLMRILYGAIRPDAGQVLLDGQPRAFRNSAEAILAGVGMVSQHYSIIPEITCLENLMLGAEPGFVVSPKLATERAETIAQRMGFQFDWKARADTLSPGGAQKLEILKLLWRRSRILVLDEPTAMLSPDDADALYASLRQLAQDGATVLVVTHRTREVVAHCDRATVLRGGRLVTSLDVKDADASSLAQFIIGHPLAELEPRPVSHPSGPGMVLKDVWVKGDRGDDAVRGVSLRLEPGEVVGLAGVDGSGQRELFQALVGVRKIERGDVNVGERPLAQTPSARRLEAGIRLIPEDRHLEGVIERWSLEANAMLGLQRRAEMRSGPWVATGARRALAEEVVARFDTRFGKLSDPIASLSGGNQQRLVAARALARDAQVILAFQPARGLDLDSTQRVYKAIREACDAGACALVVSFDLDELLEYCDRVTAIFSGVLRSPEQGSERDRYAIGRLMVGADA